MEQLPTMNFDPVAALAFALKMPNYLKRQMVMDPISAILKYRGMAKVARELERAQELTEARRNAKRAEEVARIMREKQTGKYERTSGWSGRSFDTMRMGGLGGDDQQNWWERPAYGQRGATGGGGGGERAPTSAQGQAMVASHSRQGAGETAAEYRRRRERQQSLYQATSGSGGGYIKTLPSAAQNALQQVLWEEGVPSIEAVDPRMRRFYLERAGQYMRGMTPDDIRNQRRIQMGIAQKEFVAKDPALATQMQQMKDIRGAMAAGGAPREAANVLMRKMIAERQGPAPTPRRVSAKFNEYLDLANGNPDLARKMMLQDRVRELTPKAQKPPTLEKQMVDKVLAGTATEDEIARLRKAGKIPKAPVVAGEKDEYATPTEMLSLARKIVMDNEEGEGGWTDEQVKRAQFILDRELKARAGRLFQSGQEDPRNVMNLLQKALRYIGGR